MRLIRLLALSLALLFSRAGQARQADEEPVAAVADAIDVESVLVEKAARRLTLLDGKSHAVRVFEHIQLGPNPVGPKRFEGDGRTPEGRYVIDYGNPASAYHLSLHITYPDSRDSAQAAAVGREPGGAIFLHGSPNGYASRPAGDWTEGCIALDDAEIEQIWQFVPDGTPIDIRP